MKTAIKDALSSKKFLAYLTTIIVVVGNKICGHFGYELDDQQVALLIGSAAAYIIGQGVADHGATAAQVKADNPVPVAPASNVVVGEVTVAK